MLRIGSHQAVSGREVRAALRAHPGRSVWSPDSREFVLMSAWRHRDDISLVQSIAAVRDAEALLIGAVARCRAFGEALVLVIELDERRNPLFYARTGFAPLEDVVTYELGAPVRLTEVAAVSFVPFRGGDGSALAALVGLDHAAFPWLWRNTESEFEAYAETPGVETFLGFEGDRPVAYVGVTSYGGWGHLDRIAVDPARQGEGLGRVALAFAVDALVRRGARRVGLSTQRDNVTSRRLYERFGFRRMHDHDYRLYGARLRPPATELASAIHSDGSGTTADHRGVGNRGSG